MKFTGINPIKVEGSSYDIGYGYSKFVRMNIGSKNFNPVIAAKINPFGVKEWKDKTKENVFGLGYSLKPLFGADASSSSSSSSLLISSGSSSVPPIVPGASSNLCSLIELSSSSFCPFASPFGSPSLVG